MVMAFDHPAHFFACLARGNGCAINRHALVFLLVCHLAGCPGRRRATCPGEPYRTRLASRHAGFFRLGLSHVPVFVWLCAFRYLDRPGLPDHDYSATAGISYYISLVATRKKFASFCFLERT